MRAATMTIRRLLLVALVCLPLRAGASDDLAQALEAYGRSHYAESMHLLQLATAGNNVRAQEMLGLM